MHLKNKDKSAKETRRLGLGDGYCRYAKSTWPTYDSDDAIDCIEQVMDSLLMHHIKHLQ